MVDHEDSIENEPHLRRGFFAEQPVEPPLRALDTDEQAEHSVWDEPNMQREPPPRDAVSYRTLLQQRMANLGAAQSWAITLIVAVLSGPLAILGTLLHGNSSFAVMTGMLGPVIVAPLIEEVMKNAGALWVVETRPYWFRSKSQIAICVLASGAVFAIVENLLYLNVYTQNPSPEMAAWRWTVCVALHMGCALVAGLGTMLIWNTTVRDGTPPSLPQGAPYMAAAMIIHGGYNALATLLEVFANPF